LTDAGYVVEVTGGKKSATGVAETFHEALERASWRWTHN
jgi:hypothetical protein